MTTPKLIQPALIALKGHPTLNEAWVEAQIADNPTLLRLGEVEVRDRQRTQPKAGRLDLLLEDQERKRRYEVEIQLGRCDESHIIRTIEYWDIEKKRYPQYEHCAVLIAEDVTTRFLNVIGLLNGSTPLIVIKMEAYQMPEGVALIFTKVVDEIQLGLDDTDSSSDRGTFSRATWESSTSKLMLDMVDDMFGSLREIDARYQLTYKKYYIGLSHGGRVNNIVQFRPKKNFLKLSVYLPQSDEIEALMERNAIDLEYDPKWRQYTIRITPESFRKHRDVFVNLLRRTHEYDTAD